MEPLVSIITPAFNASNFIEKTIESVLCQTLENWELLLIDDKSLDGTADIVEQYARSDRRIQLIRRGQNGGAAKARNDGMVRSQGRYVAMLDSDDLWVPEKLEHQVSFMRQRGAALSYTAYRRISYNGDRIGAVVGIPESLRYRQLLGHTAIANSTVIVDKQRVGKIRWTVGYGYEDLILWLGLLREGLVAYGLSEDLARLRIVPGSLSGDKLRSARWMWRIYREEEQLSIARSLWYLASYGTRASLKRLGKHRPRTTAR